MRSFRWIVVLLALFLSTQALAAKKQYICVFDPVGRDGDVFNMGKDLATEFLSLGVDLKLYPYTTEASAVQDFKAGLCDAAILTGLKVREFNLFAATIEAIGAIESYDALRTVLATLTQPKAGKLFVQGEYEVAGIFPAGAVFIFLKNRDWVTVDSMKGRNIIVMYGDKVSSSMVAQVGGKAVRADTSTFANKFKRGRADVVFAPAAVYEPLEMYKGLEPDGGIITQPITQLSLQIVMRKEAFPEGFGQQAREAVLEWFDLAVEIALKAEAKIEKQFWVRPPKHEVDDFTEQVRQARIRLRDEGVYDGRMLKILRKMRCRNTPEANECKRPEE